MKPVREVVQKYKRYLTFLLPTFIVTMVIGFNCAPLGRGLHFNPQLLSNIAVADVKVKDGSGVVVGILVSSGPDNITLFNERAGGLVVYGAAPQLVNSSISPTCGSFADPCISVGPRPAASYQILSLDLYYQDATSDCSTNPFVRRPGIELTVFKGADGKFYKLDTAVAPIQFLPHKKKPAGAVSISSCTPVGGGSCPPAQDPACLVLREEDATTIFDELFSFDGTKYTEVTYMFSKVVEVPATNVIETLTLPLQLLGN